MVGGEFLCLAISGADLIKLSSGVVEAEKSFIGLGSGRAFELAKEGRS